MGHGKDKSSARLVGTDFPMAQATCTCSALLCGTDSFQPQYAITGTGRENHAHQVGHAVLCNACVPEMLKLQCATGKASPQQQDLFAQISRCSSDVRFFLHCCAWRTA